MTNREKLNIIYERMGGYTNPRKDDKTGWTIYDQNPVLIGNVLQFMKDLDWDCIPNRIYILWEKLTLPIDEQSDECIDWWLGEVPPCTNVKLEYKGLWRYFAKPLL